MQKISVLIAFLFVNLAVVSGYYIPRQNGGSGKAPGTQFITGPCANDAECGSGCCGFNTGKCAGAVVAQERDGGCGFGDAQPNDDAAQALRGGGAANGGANNGAAAGGAAAGGAANNGAAGGAAASGSNTGAAASSSAAAGGNGGAAANAGSGKAPGTQFITGPCANDAECGSGCCGFNTGKCAGAVVAQERDGGCGFGDATPNDDAAQALRGGRRRRAFRRGFHA